METVITINLNGQLLQIEVPAHEALRSYIGRLSQHFATDPNRVEIISDIESRIAELLADKQVVRGVVMLNHVNDVVAQMGEPQAILDEIPAAEATGDKSAKATAIGSPPPGATRLLRNTKDKWLGGVCSGLAHHFNLDPGVVRLVVALVTLGGFGFGVVAYAVAWAIMPAGELPERGGKRLFRNPDDKMVAGVASGIAAYFHKDPTVVRLVFAAPLIFNALLHVISSPWGGHGIFSGSLTGLVMMAYVVLWVVLPKAETPYQKLQMRGEPVDVHVIQQFAGQPLPATPPVAPPRSAGSTAFRMILWVGLAIIGLTFAATVVGLIASGLVIAPLAAYAWSSSGQAALGWGTLVGFVIVPMVGFFIWLVRRMIGARPNAGLGWLFGIAWTAGWVCLPFFAMSIARDVRKSAVTTAIVPMPEASTALRIRASEPMADCDSFAFGHGHVECSGLRVGDDALEISTVDVQLAVSPDSNYHVKVIRRSRGQTQDDAQRMAAAIRYHAVQTGDVLELGSSLRVPEGQPFRGQEVDVVVQIPEGGRLLVEEAAFDDLMWTDDRQAFDRRGRRTRAELDFVDELEPDTWYQVAQGAFVEAVEDNAAADTPPALPPAAAPEVEASIPR